MDHCTYSSFLRLISQFCFPPISPCPDEPHFYAIRLTDDKARSLYACCLAFTDAGSAFKVVNSSVHKAIVSSQSLGDESTDINSQIKPPSVLPAGTFRSSLDTKVLMLISRLPLFSIWETLLRAIVRTYSGRFELDILSAYTPAGWLLPHRERLPGYSSAGAGVADAATRRSRDQRAGVRPRADAQGTASRAGITSDLDRIDETFSLSGEDEGEQSHFEGDYKGYNSYRAGQGRHGDTDTGGGSSSPSMLVGSRLVEGLESAESFDSAGSGSGSSAASGSQSRGAFRSRSSGERSFLSEDEGVSSRDYTEMDRVPVGENTVPELEEIGMEAASYYRMQEVLDSVQAERVRRAKRWAKRRALLAASGEQLGATRVASPDVSIDGSDGGDVEDEEDDESKWQPPSPDKLGASDEVRPEDETRVESSRSEIPRRSVLNRRRESTIGPLVTLGPSRTPSAPLAPVVGLTHVRSRGSIDSQGGRRRQLRRADSNGTNAIGGAYTSLASSAYGGDYEDDDDLTSVGGAGDGGSRPRGLSRGISRRSVALAYVGVAGAEAGIGLANYEQKGDSGQAAGVPGPPPRPPPALGKSRGRQGQGWSQSTRQLGAERRIYPPVASLRGARSQADLKQAFGSSKMSQQPLATLTGSSELSLRLSEDGDGDKDRDRDEGRSYSERTAGLQEDDGAPNRHRHALQPRQGSTLVGLSRLIADDPVLARIAAEEALCLVPRCLLRLRPAPPIIDAATMALAAGGPSVATNPGDGTLSPTDSELERQYALRPSQNESGGAAHPNVRVARAGSGSSSRSLLLPAGSRASQETGAREFAPGAAPRLASRRSRGQSVAAEELELSEYVDDGQVRNAALARRSSGAAEELAEGDESADEMPAFRPAIPGYDGSGPGKQLVSLGGTRSALAAVFRGVVCRFDAASGLWYKVPLRTPAVLPLEPRVHIGNWNRLMFGWQPAWLSRFAGGASCGSCIDCGVGAPGIVNRGRMSSRSQRVMADHSLHRSAASMLLGRARASNPVPLESVLSALVFDLPTSLSLDPSVQIRSGTSPDEVLQGIQVSLHLPLLAPPPRSVAFRRLEVPGRPGDKTFHDGTVSLATDRTRERPAGMGVPGVESDLSLEQEGRADGTGLNLQIRVPTNTGLPFVDPGCLLELFRCLSPEAVCACLASVLTEYRTVMFSKHMWRLTACTEALTALMFPFQWPDAFMTSIPPQSRIQEVLTAPFPILAGVHEDTLTNRRLLRQLAKEAVVIRLDDNRVHFPKNAANAGSDDSCDEDEAKRELNNKQPLTGARKKASFALFPRRVVHQLCVRLKRILPAVRMAPLEGEWECEHDFDGKADLPLPTSEESSAGDEISQTIRDGRLREGFGSFHCWGDQVRMAFLECMVALLRNVEHFAALRKGASAPGPDQVRQAGMPVMAEAEQSDISGGKGHADISSSAGAAPDDGEAKGGKYRPRTHSRMTIETAFETKAFARCANSEEHSRFLREFADPQRNTVFTYFLYSFRGCTEHAPTLSLTTSAAAQAGVSPSFDLPAAIRAVESVSRGLRKGRGDAVNQFFKGMARAIGVPQPGAVGSTPAPKSQHESRPSRSSGKYRRDKQPLSGADRNAIYFVLLLRAHRIAMAARTGWNRLAQLAMPSSMAAGAAHRQDAQAPSRASASGGVARRQRRLTLSLMIPKDAPVQSVASGQPNSSADLSIGSTAPPTVPRGLLGFAVGFFTGNRATPSAQAGKPRLDGSASTETQEDRFAALRKTIWSDNLWSPCTSSFVGGMLQLALRTNAHSSDDLLPKLQEATTLRNLTPTKTVCITPVLASLFRSSTFDPVAGINASSLPLAAGDAVLPSSPGAADFIRGICGFADGCLVLDYGEDDALAEQMENFEHRIGETAGTQSLYEDLERSSLNELRLIAGGMASGSPRRAAWISNRKQATHAMHNMARAQLQSRYSPVLVFPRLDPTLLPADITAWYSISERSPALVLGGTALPRPYRNQLGKPYPVMSPLGGNASPRSRSHAVGQLFSPQLQPLHLLAGPAQSPIPNTLDVTMSADQMIASAVAASAGGDSDDLAGRRLLYDVVHAPSRSAAIESNEVTGRMRGGLGGGSFSLSKPPNRAFNRDIRANDTIPERFTSKASVARAAASTHRVGSTSTLQGVDYASLVPALCEALVKVIRERDEAVAYATHSGGTRRGSHRASLSVRGRQGKQLLARLESPGGASSMISPGGGGTDGSAVVAAAARLPVDSTPKYRMHHALQRLVASGDVNRALVLARTATHAGTSPPSSARAMEFYSYSDGWGGYSDDGSYAGGFRSEQLASVAADAAKAAKRRIARMSTSRPSMMQMSMDMDLDMSTAGASHPSLSDDDDIDAGGRARRGLGRLTVPRRSTVGGVDSAILLHRANKAEQDHAPGHHYQDTDSKDTLDPSRRVRLPATSGPKPAKSKADGSGVSLKYRRFSAGGVLEPAAVAQFEAERRLSAIVRRVTEAQASHATNGTSFIESTAHDEAGHHPTLSLRNASQAHRTIAGLIQRKEVLEKRCDSYGVAYCETLAILGEARTELLSTHQRLVYQEAQATDATRAAAISAATSAAVQEYSSRLAARVMKLEREVAHLLESRASSDESLQKLQSAVVYALSRRWAATGHDVRLMNGLSEAYMRVIIDAADAVSGGSFSGQSAGADAISEFRLLPIDEIKPGGPSSSDEIPATPSGAAGPLRSADDSLALSKSPTKPPTRESSPSGLQQLQHGLAPLHAYLHEEISARKRVVEMARQSTGLTTLAASKPQNVFKYMQALRDCIMGQAAINRARLVQFTRVFGRHDDMPKLDVSTGRTVLGRSHEPVAHTHRRQGNRTTGGIAASASDLSQNALVVDAMQRFGTASYGHYPRHPPIGLYLSSEELARMEWLSAELQSLRHLATDPDDGRGGIGHVSMQASGASAVRQAWTASGTISALWEELALYMECLQASVGMLEAASGTTVKSLNFSDSRPGVSGYGYPKTGARAGARHRGRETPRGSPVAAASDARGQSYAHQEAGKSGDASVSTLHLRDLSTAREEKVHEARRAQSPQYKMGVSYTRRKALVSEASRAAATIRTSTSSGTKQKGAIAKVGSTRSHRLTATMATTSRAAATSRRYRLLDNLRKSQGNAAAPSIPR